MYSVNHWCLSWYFIFTFFLSHHGIYVVELLQTVNRQTLEPVEFIGLTLPFTKLELVKPNSCAQVLWEKKHPPKKNIQSPNLQNYLVASTHLNILVRLNWIISSGRGENETYLKPPTRIYCWDKLTTTPLTSWQRNQPAFWSINMISLDSIPSITLGFLLFRFPYVFSWWCTIIENDNRTGLPTTIKIQVKLTPWLFTPKCKWNCRAEYQISVRKSWSCLCVWCVFLCWGN